MKLHMILVVGCVLTATGCAEKDQATTEAVNEAPMAAPGAVAPTAGNEIWQNESFRTHMHLHAARLSDLNFALADGDLKAAKTTASWLAGHDTDSDVQSAWLPYLYRMRTEAQAVETAPDLATARAAAERITAQCQDCHAAVGVSIQ
jgi:hypothetical protein